MKDICDLICILYPSIKLCISESTNHNLSESLKTLLKKNICPSANVVQSTFLRSFEFSDNTVSGYKRPYVILCPVNTPSVPLAVRKTLRIVFVTHVSSFQKFLLCHTGSKQKWYLIPILSDTKRASSRSLRKSV